MSIQRIYSFLSFGDDDDETFVEVLLVFASDLSPLVVVVVVVDLEVVEDWKSCCCCWCWCCCCCCWFATCCNCDCECDGCIAASPTIVASMATEVEI